MRNIMKRESGGYSFQDIQQEMNKMVENALQDLGFVEKSQKTEFSAFRPAIELNENDENYQVKAELPGVEKKDIDIEVGEESITIKAHTEHNEEEKKGNIYRSEIRYGDFYRTIPLPSQIDNSRAKADFKDGLLSITVPKTEEEKKKIRKVNIE